MINLYSIGRPFVFTYFKIFHRFEICGAEHVPDRGGVLICPNHIGYQDPPMVASGIKREVSFLAKAELFSIPILKGIIKRLNAFHIKRGKGDRGAIKLMLELLSDGHTVLVFPEGTRSRNGRLGKPQAGAGYFALRSEAAVVPCAIIGDYRPFSKLRVHFGQPIDFSELKAVGAKPAEASELIMAHIRRLLEEHSA